MGVQKCCIGNLALSSTLYRKMAPKLHVYMWDRPGVNPTKLFSS
jgi:hypothetical protein